MAKKDSKKKSGKKDKAPAGAVEAVEAVRSAVERTFTATAGGAQSLRGPAQEFAGEIAAAANRIREVLEDRVVDELKGLRTDVEGLARRVSALERPEASSASSSAPAASRSAAKKPTARRPPAARKSSTASKPASARRASTSRSSAAKPASSSTASKSSTSRSSASKRASARRTSASKPAASRRASTAKKPSSGGSTSSS